MAIDHAKPRLTFPKSGGGGGGEAERSVYADAAGSTRIIDTSTKVIATFMESENMESVRASAVEKLGKTTYEGTCFICGMEVRAAISAQLEPNNDLQGRAVNFYIDNDALWGIVKNSAAPIAIQATEGRIWHPIRDIRIAAWYERVSSKRNIAELPAWG